MLLSAQVWFMLAGTSAWAQPADDNPSATASAPASEDTAEAASQPADAAALDDGLVAPPAKADPFRMDISNLYIGLETEFEHRRVKSQIADRRDTLHENHDLRFLETTGFTLSGHAYDPGLLEYRAALEFGLLQDRYRETIDGYNNSENDTGFLTEYDVSVDAFKSKPISLNVYARQSEDRVPRRFLPSLRERRTETGVAALAVLGPTTTEIGFSLRDVERHGNRLDEDDEDLEASRYYIDHTWQIADGHKLRLFYDHEHDETSYQGSQYQFHTQRDEFRAEHEYAFGPEKKHRIDTYVRYNAEQGDLARDEFELVPRLTLQHTDKFRTVHRYGFYKFEQDAIEISQHKIDSQALWTPTDRWRISVDGFALQENIDNDIDSNQFGGNVDVYYHQPTSLGELAANVGFGYDQLRTAGDAGYRVVRSEAHQMGGSRPIFLRERGVIAATVIAYSADHTRLYVPGVDYIITILAGRATVARTLTGRIADGEVVYFDYRYSLPSHGNVETYRSDFLIEHRFNFGLTPYYALEARCQQVESSLATPWERDNQNRHRLGARFEKPRWQVGAEYEIFDDSVEPYDAFHLTGRANVLQSPAHSLDFSGELSKYLFEGGADDRRVWWYEMDLTDRSRITDYLWFKAATAYHWEDDSIDGETNGVDLECGLEYRRGYLTVEVVAEYDLLSVLRGREDGFGIFLNVKRDLSHLLPAAQARR